MDTIKMIITTKEDGNMAYHVNDLKSSVDENRLKISQKHNFDISKLRYMNQVHGDNIEIVDFSSPLLIDNCDALITKEKDLPIMVIVADCIPIFLKDSVKGVIAVVHAGRNSTFLNIVQKTALKMIEELDCKKEDISVYLGPSIQKCCYEVSPELEDIVIKSYGKEFSQNRYIDLQGINVKQLNDIGIFNIEISNICTKCSNKPYFSYRNDKDCGRFAIIAVL
ncbi:peptidoglycan editing factor PgeF [Arcobacter sp.]|uniref:peptidoglycan editing factor PgeF n=1 Tax=Arcobacter sp. TaxID=1872629 RepID=UPI003D0C6A10